MRKFYTILFLLTTYLLNAQERNGKATSYSGCTDSVTKFKTICAADIQKRNYLLVVDGVVKELSFLENIASADIESITLYEHPSEHVYCMPQKPWLILALKKKTFQCLTIRDQEDGRPIPGATIHFENAIIGIADSNGVVAFEAKREKNQKIRITSTGYLPQVIDLSIQTQVNDTIPLSVKRNNKAMEEVVINGPSICRTRCSMYCRVSRSQCIEHRPIDVDRSKTGAIYPNPSRSGGSITIQPYQPSGTWQVDLINASGQVLKKATFSNQSSYQLQLPMVPPGSYFVRVTNKSANKSFTTHLIIDRG
jgi:hypothetical protein